MVFFLKKKSDNRISPRAIKLLSFLLLTIIIYLSFFGGKNPVFMECEKGGLVSIDSCKAARSQPDSKRVWWFSDAFGPLDKKVCSQMSMEEETLSFAVGYANETDILLRSSCSSIGLTDDNFCYTSQHLSADGITREVRILTANSHCAQARYFRGQNATLFEHIIKPGLNPSEIIKDMPEIK